MILMQMVLDIGLALFVTTGIAVGVLGLLFGGMRCIIGMCGGKK